MRIKSYAIFVNWIVCGMGLFGMSQYIGLVGGDIFINFALSGLIQIPGNFLAWWTMNALGRRITLVSSNLIAGVAALALLFANDGTRQNEQRIIGIFMIVFFFNILLFFLFQSSGFN